MDTKLGTRHLTKDMQDLVLCMVNDTVGTLAGGRYSNKDVVAAVILAFYDIEKRANWSAYDDYCRLWDVSDKIVQLLETKSPITSIEVSQDGRYIITTDGSTVRFWDANHFGLVKSHNMPFNVESASLEPKLSNNFIAGGEDMWIHMFDFHTGEEIGCNEGHHGPVHCVRFSPGGESYAWI
ncbi:hypothetical protein SO802_018589 [Lithocarpus litseifolius]|uniref:Serine-threonine kinase receptor-associated protein n=1 Tax=Lithocarpus litseifolius TaxID=425828 RepID=A0AAW2CL74_9ROSI